MSRPIYETAQDRANELDVMNRICGDDITYKKLPMRDFIDFALFRDDELVSLVEVRHRKTAMRKFPTLYCDAAKVLHARAYSELLQVPVYLFVQWSDKLAYINFNEAFKTSFNGNKKNTRDEQEQSLVAHFDIDLFREVNR